MKIVVGIDGSAGAQDALQFACEEAVVHQADLVIVHAWDYYPYTAGDGMIAGDVLALVEPQAQAILDEASTQASERCGPNTAVAKVLVRGSAARALLDEGKEADLIVVGSRGRGGFTSLLLGSTSHQVVHHATVPVTVIRSPEA